LITLSHLRVQDLSKHFTLHLQGGTTIPVLDRFSLDVEAGTCVVLRGPSGIGKSTILKLVYGSYKPWQGRVCVEHRGEEIDLVAAGPRILLAVRRETLGYVSQFLRVIPRVATLDVVAEPLVMLGVERDEARQRASILLRRLRIKESLWSLPPATFSGGEQQRVNIARSLVHPYPILLLDEPTASLDAFNRATVVELIQEAKARGAACLGIFHDQDVRTAVADRIVDMEGLKAAA
jgi:alpha-D-ribose 1-methylphosphonate 5-triphosphate synthase subunit PhnL